MKPNFVNKDTAQDNWNKGVADINSEAPACGEGDTAQAKGTDGQLADARRTAAYWKEGLAAANSAIDELRAQLATLQAENTRLQRELSYANAWREKDDALADMQSKCIDKLEARIKELEATHE